MHCCIQVFSCSNAETQSSRTEPQTSRGILYFYIMNYTICDMKSLSFLQRNGGETAQYSHVPLIR